MVSVFSLVVFFLLILQLESTLTPKSPRGSNKDKIKTEKIRTGPQNYTVYTKKYVTESPNSKDIIANHGAFFREVDEFSFADGLVLGYVTPVCFFHSKQIIFHVFSS